MDLTYRKKSMMRKRHAFLSETVKGYTSLEEMTLSVRDEVASDTHTQALLRYEP